MSYFRRCLYGRYNVGNILDKVTPQNIINSILKKFDTLDKMVENELDGLKTHVDGLGRSLTENVDSMIDEIIEKSLK